MEVTIERIQDETDERHKGYHEDFTVFINGKRILSVFSNTDPVATKWISEVRKACRKKKGPVIAGVSVDRDIRYRRGGVSDNPYETLTLCVGSHCLICSLPECWIDGKYGRSDEASKVLRDFLADRNVIFIGIDTEEVSQRLERFQSLKIARSGDVRALAVKLLKEERGSVSDKLAKSLSLDDVAKQVLDKRMDVDRPKKMDRWNWNYWGCRTFDLESHKEVRRFVINREYVKFQTLDAYLCHEIGIKYLDEFKKMSSS